MQVDRKPRQKMEVL